jgi:hypothetical protein
VGAVIAAHLDQVPVHRLHAGERADDDLEEGRAGCRQHEGRLADAEDDQEEREQGDLRHRKDEREVRLDEVAHGTRHAHEEPEWNRGHGGERERERQARHGDE